MEYKKKDIVYRHEKDKPIMIRNELMYYFPIFGSLFAVFGGLNTTPDY